MSNRQSVKSLQMPWIRSRPSTSGSTPTLLGESLKLNYLESRLKRLVWCFGSLILRELKTMLAIVATLLLPCKLESRDCVAVYKCQRVLRQLGYDYVAIRIWGESNL